MATDHGRVEPLVWVYPMRVALSGPRSLQSAEVHTSHLGLATLHLMNDGRELCLTAQDDGSSSTLSWSTLQKTTDSDDR